MKKFGEWGCGSEQAPLKQLINVLFMSFFSKSLMSIIINSENRMAKLIEHSNDARLSWDPVAMFNDVLWYIVLWYIFEDDFFVCSYENTPAFNILFPYTFAFWKFVIKCRKVGIGKYYDHICYLPLTLWMVIIRTCCMVFMVGFYS